MKIKSLLLIASLALASINASSQQAGNDVTKQLLSAWSPRNFAAGNVPAEYIDLILKCGLKAPSARNLQPWRFTVIKDEGLLKEIMPSILQGNILIIVSALDSQQPGVNPVFDCGLAAQNMFIAATSLGIGARIVGGPVAAAEQRRSALQIPDGYKPVIAIRIGNLDKSVDAVSAASSRKTMEELVTYK